MERVTWKDLDRLEALKRVIAGRVHTFATMFCQELNNEIVIATPVVFGFLRGSWFSGLNQTPGGAGLKDPSGADTIGRLNVVALTLTLGDVYYLVNTAIYAARMEYGFFGKDKLGRNINQAGRGFIRGVVSRASLIAFEVAKRVRTGQYDA